MIEARGFTPQEREEIRKAMKEHGIKKPVAVKMREETYLTFKKNFAIIEEREEEEMIKMKELGDFGIFNALKLIIDNTLTEPYEVIYE